VARHGTRKTVSSSSAEEDYGSPLKRAELPPSLMEVHLERLGDNPLDNAELERLASAPQRLLPSPADRRVANLAQYKGRSIKGQRNVMANLMRPVPNPLPDLDREPPRPLPPNLPKPLIPTATPPAKLMSAANPRYRNLVLTMAEYDLYLQTWRAWLENHPESDNADDRPHIETICLETVQQFRLQMLSKRRRRKHLDAKYHQSCRRMQKAGARLVASARSVR
jgi:hypothetical protein